MRMKLTSLCPQQTDSGKDKALTCPFSLTPEYKKLDALLRNEVTFDTPQIHK